MYTRRDALTRLSALAGAAVTAACTTRKADAVTTPAPESTSAQTPTAGAPRMPAIFLAHGAPPLLEDPLWMSELAAWGKALPRPKAILSLSAHWDARPVRIGATEAIPLIYDFYGFPDHFYRLKYPSPGAPTVAARVRDLLRGAGMAFTDDPGRGLDHGTWVPLLPMYPQADIPVLQISLPGLDPKTLFALGRALAPLRDEGVLIIGSGFLTHNMRAFSRETPAWAAEFDQFCAETLAKHDVDALLDYQTRGPATRIALPTVEHFVPVIVAAGAADAFSTRPQVSFPVTGFAFGSFTKRSVQYS
jgi:4,5-DOPA dioxygenase extradiol